MEEEYFWKDDDTIVVGGTEFSVKRKGVAYARFTGQVVGWLGSYALGGLFAANEAGILEVEEGAGDEQVAFKLIAYLMSEGIPPEGLVELSAVLLGSDYEFAEEYWDPGWTMELIMKALQDKGIRKAVSRVWEQFFLVRGDLPVDEED